MEVAVNKLIQIRWLIRRDMPEVLQIERDSFPQPWTDEDFLCCLRQKNCVGMVAEWDHQIVGYMLYELHRSRLTLLNLAVLPKARRKAVGALLINRLKDKLSPERRSSIDLDVRETNLDAQLFFQSRGFVATGVIGGHYPDTCEDAFSFIYRADW